MLRRSRVGPIAIALLLTFQVLALALPSALAGHNAADLDMPGIKLTNIEVVGEDGLHQWFANPGETVTLRITVKNYGTQALPAGWILQIVDLGIDGPSKWKDKALVCTPVDEPVPARTSGSLTTPTGESAWGVLVVEQAITLPSDTITEERAFEVYVNPKQPDYDNDGVVDIDKDSDGDGVADDICPNQAGTHVEEHDQDTQEGDSSVDDNYKNATFALGIKPDLTFATPSAVTLTGHWGGSQAGDPAATGVLWCGGTTSPSDGPLTLPDCGTIAHENTSYTDGDVETFFMARVVNTAANSVYMGGEKHLVQPGLDRADADNHVPVDIGVRVEHLASGTILDLDRVDVTEWDGYISSCGEDGGSCTFFDLFQAAGTYRVTFTIDPDGEIPDGSPGNNVITRDIVVGHVDLAGSFDLSAMDEHVPEGETMPVLPPSGTLDFSFTVSNEGNRDTEPARGPVRWKVYLVDPAEDEPLRDITTSADISQTNALTASDSATATVSYTYTNDANQVNNYLRGGLVKIRLVIDDGATTGTFVEECEDPLVDSHTAGHCDGRHNVVETAFKIQDEQKPELLKWGITWEDENDVLQWHTGTTGYERYKGEPVNFTAVVTDNDRSLHSTAGAVTLVLTYPDGTTEELVFPTSGAHLKTIDNGPDQFWFNLTFPAGFMEHGTFAYTLKVEDHSGNTPTATIPVRSFVVDQWPIQTAEEDVSDCQRSCSGIWLEKPAFDDNEAEENPDDYGGYTWIIEVTEAQTGIPNADTTAAGATPVQGKYITLWNPAGEKEMDRVLLAPRCTPSNDPDPTTDGCEDVTQYHMVVTNTDLGNFRSLIEIEDAAGEVRALWWNFTARDALPRIDKFTSPVNDDGHVLTVDAGEPYALGIDVWDDSGHIPEAYAEWVHRNADGEVDHTLNVTLQPGDVGSWGNAYTTNFSYVFSTGWLQQLPLAGEWSVTIALRELQRGESHQPGGAGLWTHVPLTITVVDDSDPDILGVSVSQTEEEWGSPITWRVTVEDETNFTARLTINEKGGAAVPLADGGRMTGPNEHGEFEFTHVFSPTDADAVTYEWSIRIEDSAGNVRVPGCDNPVLKQCTVKIVKNAAPRFVMTAPSDNMFVPDMGSYFVPAKPSISVLVYDNNNISLDDLRVFFGPADGELTDITSVVETRRNANPLGYFLEFDHTNVEAHGTVLTLRIDAQDLSNPARTATGWFNFTVDAAPPTSHQLDDFAPRYRASATDVWNVNTDTLFKITATDGGGSGVDHINYRVDSEGKIFTVPVAGFKLPVTSGGVRVIHYSAVDRVGNAEDWKSLSIFVDTRGPVFSKLVPTVDYQVDEKWTNFTVIDEGAGVQRVSTFYRIANGEYQELVLTYNDTKDMWVGQLPNLTKGDRIQLYAVAYDFLGNKGVWGSAESAAANFTVGNRRPTFHILEPAFDDTVQGVMTIRWSIADPDGDPVTVDIYYKSANEERFYTGEKGVNGARGAWQFDTTTLIDGDYTFDLSAYDGAYYARTLLNVTVKNDRSPIEDAKLDNGAPQRGDTVVVTAHITKKDVLSVKAVIKRDGVEVDTILMNDDGENGDLQAEDLIYAASFVADTPGKYTTEIVVEYREEGVVKRHRDAVEFTIETKWTDVLQDNALTWVAIGALSLGAVGVGAWGVTRRW